MHWKRFPLLVGIGFVAGVMAAVGQPPSRWSLHFQATSIGQHHGSFPSLYEGENSLPPHPESRASITATFFLGLRVNRHIDLVVNPEVAGGKGFGMTTGLGGFTNGEISRTSGADLVLYAVTDYFDNNTYSHDHRTQFMNWALMYNGAWDYPADTRGYTLGTMEELTMRKWSLRLAHALEPTTPNGPTFDFRVARNRGDVIEWERRHTPKGRFGVLRLLGFANRERAGTFREAMQADGTTNIESTRRDGTLKYGFGVNLEQSVTTEVGVFGRYGWSDGKTESWAFTQVDRSLSGGVSISGSLWKRKSDHIGIAGVRDYLSGDQRSFLAHGGLGFIIGDGRLDHYRPEDIVEAYYSWRAAKEWTITADFQHVRNPAYNADRGPVSVGTIRLHWER